MTLSEFKSEFRYKYDAASSGGPDLNSYEISLCLTQAVRDIIEDAYSSYETNEKSKRILAPLLKTHDSSIEPFTDDLTDYKCFLISLPTDLNYVLLEEAKLDSCNYHIEIVNTDLDYLRTFLRNPFKKPNDRKIIKIEYNKEKFKIYTIKDLNKYRITYLKKYSPIIVDNFINDPELIGNESIEGFNVQKTTELPYFIHDEIVDKAVIIAIKTSRENNLQTQTQLP